MPRRYEICFVRWFVSLLGFMMMLNWSHHNGHAQETPDELDAQTLAYNEVVSGDLDNRTPSIRYRFEGLRGEYVTIRLDVTDGNLDPVLTLIDPMGNPLFMRDDALGDTDSIISQIQLADNGQYMLIAARFGHQLGSTSGAFDLRIDRSGVSSESGSALRYGDTVVNTISDSQPQVYYTFRAARGDIISLTMLRNSGTLDPYLRIVNGARRILAENDDTAGVNTARIVDYVVEEDGQYLIIATRYGFAGGTTTGSFFLTLQRSDDSGVGNSAQVAVRLLPGQPVEGEITTDQSLIYYSFEARRDDVITLRMNRVSGTLDPLLELLNAGLQQMVSNDDIEEGVNRDALIGQFRIPSDGLYYVIATRFEREAGASLGRFRLELTSRGNLFDGITGAIRLSYGSSATGVINDTTPQSLYVFYGAQGDAITASASRSDGDLVPVLTLLDETQTEIISGTNDESGVLTRIDRYVLPRTGLYYVQVSAGEGRGGFLVILAQRFD